MQIGIFSVRNDPDLVPAVLKKWNGGASRETIRLRLPPFHPRNLTISKKILSNLLLLLGNDSKFGYFRLPASR
jgi:hypothetical protein